ncbi:MAG TPA: PEGA domain-containing protein [Rectinemataceae bacterium]|nr:PEGA domain-containing protein [Rectinemataceae bacterium]
MNCPRSTIVAIAVAAILAPFLSGVRLCADDLRTLVAGTAIISADDADGTRLSMGYNDAIAVLLAKDTSFVQGFEIELRLPQVAIGVPGGFAYELWRKIDPLPDKNRYGYRGERIITQPIPPRAGIVLQIPIRKDFNIKPSPYATLIPTVVEPRDFPFMFKLLPVAKGFGSEIESAQFQVRVRPILTDEGALSLKIRYPEGASDRGVTVTVDDRKIDPSVPLVLSSGPHRLQVTSEAYRDENRSFTIEQGKTLELAVELQDTAPVAIIEAPDSAFVSIDGVKVDHVNRPQVTLDPGDHVVLCRIGDYTVSRRFTAFRGKTYRLVLAVDLQIQESQ